jgi:hypothetical protein
MSLTRAYRGPLRYCKYSRQGLALDNGNGVCAGGDQVPVETTLANKLSKTADIRHFLGPMDHG